jgi:hypothetical protein
MKNKHLFQILLLSVMFMALAIVAITPSKKNISQNPISKTPETSPPQNRSSVLLDSVSAFALRAFIKTSPPLLLQTNNLKVNNQLIKDGLAFPFEKLSTDSHGVITVELSAFHIGKNPYLFDKDVVIASITIPDTEGLKIESFSIDNNVTQFLSNDAVSEVKVITKTPNQQ